MQVRALAKVDGMKSRDQIRPKQPVWLSIKAEHLVCCRNNTAELRKTGIGRLVFARNESWKP